MHAVNNGCGCNGLSGIPTHELSGMGFTDTTLIEQPAQQQEWWQKAIQEVMSRLPGTPTSYPIYTPPQYPSQYPTGYPEEYSYQEPVTNWTPLLIGGLVLLFLTRRK